jgi:hypothetical protein
MSESPLSRYGIPFLLCILQASACTPQDDAGETEDTEEVAEVSQAFSGYAGAGATNGVTSIPVSYGTQGFLTAVAGNLTNPGGSAFPAAATNVSSSPPFLFNVTATRGSSSYTTHSEGWAVYPGDNTTAYNTCSHGGAGSQSVTLAAPAGGGNYACFISAVTNYNGNSFGSYGDKAVVSYPSGVPTLTCYNDSEARAQCVPITSYLGYVAAGSSSTSTSTNLGAVDWTNGKVCLLYGVWGSWRTNSTSDTVRTYQDGTDWHFTTSPGKGGYVACMY